MAKKIDYASMYTLRKDGRYVGSFTDEKGRHFVYDRDPEKLWHKLNDPKPAKAVTFKDIAEQWQSVRWETLSYKSIEAYRAPFRRLCERFGEREINSIETMDVSAYLAYLAQQGYAKRSVQLHRDMMSQIYNTAIANGLTRYNPCDHAVMPKNLAAGTRGIPSDEAIVAVRNGLNKPFGLFACICLYAGLRRGEALALRYEDIDRDAMLIHITKSVEYVGNNAHIKAPKTENGKRDVILLDVLSVAIPNGKGYIFAQENGNIITRQQYAEAWKRYCKAIGHQITAHQLRHGYATLLFEAGIPDKDAQELLGHADITLTRNIYTHIRAGHKQQVASQLNAFLGDKT